MLKEVFTCCQESRVQGDQRGEAVKAHIVDLSDPQFELVMNRSRPLLCRSTRS